MPDKVRVLMHVTTNTPIAYPIAVVADSREQVAANRFIEFVRSGRGQFILVRDGFGAP